MCSCSRVESAKKAINNLKTAGIIGTCRKHKTTRKCDFCHRNVEHEADKCFLLLFIPTSAGRFFANEDHRGASREMKQMLPMNLSTIFTSDVMKLDIM